MISLRENWRIVALVVLVVASGVALFVPGVGAGSAGGETGPTNLQYGLNLAGGTQIRAPLVGLTAENVEVGDRNRSAVEEAVAANLPNVSARDVVYRPRLQSEKAPAIEVQANVSRATFRSALEAADVSFGSIRAGVTAETRTRTVRIIRDKIDQSGLADRTVQSVFSPAEGRWYIQVEIPGRNVSESISIIESEGQVRVYAYHSVQRGNETVWVNTTALTQRHLERVGIAQRQDDGTGGFVSVTVTDGRAEEFQRIMVETGIAQTYTTDCGWPGNPRFSGDRGPCLIVVADGQVIGSYGMNRNLGRPMVRGTWASDPGFRLLANNYSEARQVSINLRAGALPTELAVRKGTQTFISPSRGSDFKFYALLTGIVAVLAVAGVVFLRYQNPLVAAPMVVTALSEVFVLLGFAAITGLALDLSHIAGFIAVIGTGADDLIIIADEVISEGRISGGRVFQNRFRKAFWVIGAAAITTLIAMSPLAFLSLGDLRGFAIVTIAGVLIGVLVTRPAYGNILRTLLAGE